MKSRQVLTVAVVVITVVCVSCDGSIIGNPSQLINRDIVENACGENCTWFFDSGRSALTISGTGNMSDYAAYKSPWEYLSSTVREIIIEKGITSIGNFSFQGLSILSSVSIPSTVLSIGESAFENCPKLSSVTIPASVTSIGSSAFANCSELSLVIYLGDDSLQCSGNVFSGYTSLSLCVTSDFYDTPYFCNLYYYCIPQNTVDCGNDSTVLFCVDQTSESESGVKSCSKTCYDGTEQDSSGSEQEWWEYNESSCTLIIKKSKSNFNNPEDVPWSKFANSICTVLIEDGVTFIGDSYFGGCTNLSKVSISTTVKSIGSSAFTNCSSLSSIEIPPSVESIGSNAFSGCSRLSSISIPNGVKTIEAFTFYQCSSLINFSIPSSVDFIGSSAFSNCSKLSTVTINNGVKTIKNSAFSNCSSLSSIEIPSTVESIGNYAFSGCTSLLSIIIPNGVVSVNMFAFYGCRSLVSITIPPSVKSIDVFAFCGCLSLSSIEIPSSVKSIANYSFSGCNKLVNVTYLGLFNPESQNIGLYKKASVCVPLDYSSTKFCDLDVCSNISSLKDSDLANKQNECYQVIVCSDCSWSVRKRQEATDCEVSDTNSKLPETGWTVEIDTEGLNSTDFNDEDVREMIRNVCQLEASSYIIKVEENSNGEIVRIFVYVDDETVAQTIATSVKAVVEKECRS